MATFLIVSGGIVCALGIASLIGGVPLLVSGFDPTMVEAGTVGVVGGILIIGVGSLLKAVRQLGARPDRRGGEGADAEVAPPAVLRSSSPHREAGPRDLPPRRDPYRGEAAREHADAETEAAPRGPAREPIAEAPPTMHASPPAPVAVPPAPTAASPVAAPPSREQHIPAAPPRPENSSPPETSPRPDPFRAAWQKAWEQGWEGETPTAARDAAAPEATATPADSPAPDHNVVKSGVIGGMHYTLYADGSIEAELAEGLVRFPSVQALRAHVERAEAARSSGD